ncbi:MAG: glycosyltransferase [Bacteroidota bacterium]
MPKKLSVTIITFNEAENIGACLEAAWQVADEIVVVDSYSTDNTKQICIDNGVKFFEHEFEGYKQQKNYATDKATYDLILALDADEVLSNELISSIQKVKQNPEHNAYTINRMSFYVNKFIKHGHWFPDKIIRVFRKGTGEWGGREPHALFKPYKNKHAPLIKGVLYHYTFKSIKAHLQQVNNLSSIGSKQLSHVSIGYLILKALLSPIWSFWYGFIFRLGFLDRWHGFTIAILSSTETFLKYSKAIMARLRKKTKSNKEKTDVSVSLIISTYNWPEALKQCLESVKRQYLLPNEVIIADDGSTEETAKLINEFKKDFPVPLHHSWIEDKGFRLSKSRNEALKIARYNYIIQIDGDIYLNNYFIYDHAKFAKKGSFVRGSRVLLNDTISDRLFKNEIEVPNIFMKGTVNFFNGVRIPFLKKIFARKKKSINGIRGCNMAYWKENAYKVNGYNENIVGWGREDSEFVARLTNVGLYKRNLRLGGVQFHIYHEENDRKLLNKNDDILNDTLKNNLTYCTHGITCPTE